MNRLRKYLEAKEWQRVPSDGYPSVYTAAEGEWLYQWLLFSVSASPLKEAHLCRRPLQAQPSPSTVEVFIVKDENRALQVMQDLSRGVHPASPAPDPKTGHKIGHL